LPAPYVKREDKVCLSNMYNIHHVAVTASNFETSLKFYEDLGFTTLYSQHFPEKQKKIALLGVGNLKLELFWYEGLENDPAERDTIGNNVRTVGPKHFALRVDSLQETQKVLQAKGIPLASEPDTGDAGYLFFFIRDPDGIWIEFVQDDKYA
jgi:glyoxylase I family protein